MLVMASFKLAEGTRSQAGVEAEAAKGHLNSLCNRDCWATGGTCKKTYKVAAQGFKAYCEDYCEPGRAGCISKFPEADKSDDLEGDTPAPARFEKHTSDDDDADLEEEAVTPVTPVDNSKDDETDDDDELTVKQADLQMKIDVADFGGDDAKALGAVEQIQDTITNCKAKDTKITRDSCCLMSCFQMRDVNQLVKAKCITNCVLAPPKPMY
eukprot:TRINITY_DN29292_c0_g1_i1.p1 TRINITY_DN29292_c0_g1~~TRINITY_DN29292_c0_g1_i1.p1  ORF type:complete len:243 (+),score=56.02 TRINITY_DN29292_c0_g1_i1:97-729(+)